MRHASVPALRLFPFAAAAVVTVLFLTGCSTFSLSGAGSGATADAAQKDSATASGSAQTEDAQGAPSAAPGPLGDSPEFTSVEKPDATESEKVAVGTIEVLMDERLFHYDASSCLVSDDEVFVIGEGAEASTGAASTFGVFTEPNKLLHERSGLWHASGLAVVTVDNQEFVSDGRMEKVGAGSLSSVFDYKISGNSIEYVLAWYSGEAKVRAGYIKVTCY